MEKTLNLASFTEEEKAIQKKLLPKFIFERVEGYMSATPEYGNISITTPELSWRASRLVCMPGQCSTCIVCSLYDFVFENLKAIEELARFYQFTKIVMTDNRPKQQLVDAGYTLYDELENERTNSTVYFYSKCL